MKYDWPTARARFIQATQDTPLGHTEDKVFEAFSLHAQTVVALMDKVAGEHVRKRFESPWAILAHRCAPLLSAGRPLTVEDTSERDAAIRRAEAWLRNCGHLFDRRAEVEDELFGPLGILRDYADDELLRARLLARWGDDDIDFGSGG